MQNLSALDAAFLQLETAETPMHLSSVHLLQLPEGYQGDFPREFMRHVASRVHLAPMLNRKLAQMPFDLANPVWIHDDDLDIGYHVRRHNLPAPGSMEQLLALCGRLHSNVMDRTRPLWELVLIEGLNDGDYAMFIKVHHSGIDGLSGRVMVEALFDATPEPRKVPPPPLRPRAAPAGSAELVAAGLRHAAVQSMQTVRTFGNLSQLYKAGTQLVEALRGFVSSEGKTEDGGAGKSRGFGAPRLPFNTSVSNQRLVGVASIPMSDCKAVAKAGGATINDLVLAVASGALRRYLKRRGELPERSLVALMPMSLREADDTDMTNRVTMAPCNLHTDIAEPRERLRAISSSTRVIKERLAQNRALLITDIPSFGVPWLVSAMVSLAGKLKLADLAPVIGNIVISNVPTSPVPLYIAGARVLSYWPMLILTHGQGLAMSVHTYAGSMEWGVVGCRRAVPDAPAIAGDLLASFEALKQSVLSAPAEAAAAAPARTRKPRAAAKPAAAAEPAAKSRPAAAAEPAAQARPVAAGRPASKTAAARPRQRAAGKSAAAPRKTGPRAVRRSKQAAAS